jgi:aminopeptidase
MTDTRVRKMAEVITGYSLALRERQLAVLRFEPAGFPLVVEVYRLALEAGAHPVLRAQYQELDELRFRVASDEQLSYVSDIDRLETEAVDARLSVRASENVKGLAGVDPVKQALVTQARKPLFERVMERRGKGELATCLTQFPTRAYAQLAGMSLAEYEDFVFRACFVDRDDPVAEWRRVSAEQQRYVDLLDKVGRLRFEAGGTDLAMSVSGRKWINSDGKANFPSGEVFTAPVEDSVNGRIEFDIPAIYLGHAVEGITLEFRDGRVVAATAGQGEEFLVRMLDSDEGARVLGEAAFGLNYAITHPTGNILFDEKIGGTVHFAVGAGYPDSGSRNKSAIHWDMIRSMKPGRVQADGELIYEDGRFTV